MRLALLALALLWVSSVAHAAGTEYFVAPDGNDSNSGQTVALPWRTLAHALPRLEAGDTLQVRGGTYAERGLTIGTAGTASAPITIRAFPSEHPVIDGAYAEFTAAGNKAWEKVDGAKSIWRSVQAFPGAGEVYGFFGPGDGGWRLVPYESYGSFSTDNEDYAVSPPDTYLGPGVFWNATDGRIYYRSQHGRYQSGDGVDVPAQLDPRQTPLFLFPKGELIDVAATAAYVVIEGLDLRHGASAIRIQSGAHHVTVRDCALRGGRYAALVQTGAHDLIFDQLVVADTFPSWVAWSDVKQPSSAPPGHLLQGAAILLADAVDGVDIGHCRLTGGFDAIDATGAPSHLRVHDCSFDARDDVLQLGTAGWAVEFDHNRTLRAHSGGPSWNGSGSPPAGQAGTIFIHHNVLDTTQPQRFGRADPRGLLDSKYQGPRGDGFATGRTFGSHSKDAATGPAPWKIYHNTALVNADVGNGGAGQAYELPQHDAAVPHEVVNNIFVQRGDQWLLRDARVDDGSQVHDGNLYWAPHRRPGTDLLEDLRLGHDELDFASLAAFLGSGVFNATQPAYAPGWESHGVEGDPRLDDQLRPSPTGPAASGAVDLSGKGWPGLTGETFRGALAPGP